jgi:hypothetical protein
MDETETLDDTVLADDVVDVALKEGKAIAEFELVRRKLAIETGSGDFSGLMFSFEQDSDETVNDLKNLRAAPKTVVPADKSEVPTRKLSLLFAATPVERSAPRAMSISPEGKPNVSVGRQRTESANGDVSSYRRNATVEPNNTPLQQLQFGMSVVPRDIGTRSSGMGRK